MARFFNTTGPCNPAWHYMLPPEARLPLVRPLIAQQLYFMVHAARQSGKTTSFLAFARALTAEGRYAALHASCETGQPSAGDVDGAVTAVIRSIEASVREQLSLELRPPEVDLQAMEPESRLAYFLELWCRSCPRPVVLFLDEIDALLDTSLISVLRQLRRGFPARPLAFPSSVALIGLRDVRDYKVRSQVLREESTLGTASPFNIKADSLTLRNFTAEETADLLLQHTTETRQPFTPEALAEVFHQSQGQPWLVNALAGWCTTRPDSLVPDPSQTVTREHVLQARETLIERRDMHLDSLMDKLREERVRRVIEPILTGDVAFDPSFDDDFSYVRDLGIVARQEGQVAIANPIYQEIIPRVLSLHVQMAIPDKPAWFVAADGKLDMARLIDCFIDFWRENGEVLLRGMPYHEAAPHLVFMAYLQRVVNAGGRIVREFAVGTRRADLVVDFGGRSEVIELKLATAARAKERGVEQVSAYARRLGRDRGWLILFDPASTHPWEERGRIEEVAREGVTVVVVWC